MSKKRVEGPAPDAQSSPRKLTYKQELFVNNYVRHGNGTLAAIDAGYPRTSAHSIASENLQKPEIHAAIDAERAVTRERLRITRDDLLKVYIGMALAEPGMFAGVDPSKAETFADLGIFAYAIEGFEDAVPGKAGRKLKLANRKAALDALWEKLGMDKAGSQETGEAGFARILRALGAIAERKPE